MTGIDKMLGGRTWAVVGVSTDTNKYGFIIFNFLKKAGYKVYGVNPKLDELDGEKVYPDLASLPQSPDVVNFVVPPGITAAIIPRLAELNIKYAWVQPGAGSAEVLASAAQNNIEVVEGCVMAELGRRA